MQGLFCRNWRFRSSRTPRPISFLPAVAILMLPMLFATGCASPPPVPTDAQDFCPLSASTFSGWFHSGSVSLNGAVDPANSLNFLAPNCGFYQWSEQMFLWLTSPAPAEYGGGAHIFDSAAFFDVSPPDASGNRTFIAHTPGLVHVFPLRAAQVGPHGLPVILDRSGKLLEVKTPDPKVKPLVRDPSGKPVEIAHVRLENNRPVLLDTEGKVINAQHARTVMAITAEQRSNAFTVQKFVIDGFPIFIDPSLTVIDVEQGQADGGVLEAQAAANGSLVYYATMVNDVYAYFLTGVKHGAITTATPGQFPTTMTDLNNIEAYATAHGKGSPPFPDPNALAIEVKTSWVLAAGLPNPNSYITMTATIPTYDQSNPNTWTPSGQQTVQMALVGMHVVGSTAGHPEMVWATFEHVDNAPIAGYQYLSTGSPSLTTVAQTTTGPWVFSSTGSTGASFNVEHMTFSGPPSNNIQSKPGFTISPSDTLRMQPWGLDGANADSNTEVISMNSHVRGMLASGDVRGNYIMRGTTWTAGGSPPSFGNLGVGTNQLANTTMETYQQGLTNCFSCHQTFGGPNGLDPNGISHVYGALNPLF